MNENEKILAKALTKALDLTPEQIKEAKEVKGNPLCDQINVLTAATEVIGLPDKDSPAFPFATEIYNSCARFCRAYADAIEKEKANDETQN